MPPILPALTQQRRDTSIGTLQGFAVREQYRMHALLQARTMTDEVESPARTLQREARVLVADLAGDVAHVIGVRAAAYIRHEPGGNSVRDLDRRMIRSALRIVAVLTTLVAVTAPAASATRSRAPRCATAQVLVAYYVSNFWTSDNALVIRRDGHASVCWERRKLGPTDQLISSRSGRSNFIVAHSKMTALLRQLERIGVAHLGPAARRLQARWLVYRGKRVPLDGNPRTTAGRKTLQRAEAILDSLIAGHAPP